MCGSPIKYLAGCLAACLTLGTCLADSAVQAPVSTFRIPTVLQRGDRIYVFWPEALVLEPLLTAHELPELRPIWSRSPELPSTNRAKSTGSESQNDLLAQGAVAYAVGDLLVLSTVMEDGSLLIVALNGATGEQRYRIALDASAENVETRIWSDRWLFAGEAKVFDLSTGEHLTELKDPVDSQHAFAVQDAVLYLAQTKKSGLVLRRSRLPAGDVDCEVPLSRLLPDVNRIGAERRVVAAWEQTAVVQVIDRPAESNSDRRQLFALDLDTKALLWSTRVGLDAQLIISAESKSASRQFRVSPPQGHPPGVPWYFSKIDGAMGESAPYEDPAIHLASTWWTPDIRAPQSPLTRTYSRDKLWTLERRLHEEDSAPSLACIDLATGKVEWSTLYDRINPSAKVFSATQSSDDESQFLVILQHETLHVFRRDNGEIVGAITPQIAGVNLRPAARPNVASPEDDAASTEEFWSGPWPELLLYSFLLAPILCFALYALWKQRSAKPS
jgi:hypothetical protein